jgi:hypothetical protein
MCGPSQTSAIALSKPVLLGIPMTAVRYGLPLVGIVLLLAAVGLSRIDGWLHAQSRDRIPRHLAATLGCLAFLAWNPVISPLAPGTRSTSGRTPGRTTPLYQGQYAEKARPPVPGGRPPSPAHLEVLPESRAAVAG